MFTVIKIVLCLLAIKDIKTRRIENYITYPMIVAAIMAGIWIQGLKKTIVLVAFSLIIWSLLFLLKAIGGADVKIMVAIGCLIEPMQNLKIMAISIVLAALVGGVVLFGDLCMKKQKINWRRKMAFIPCLALSGIIIIPG